MTIYMIVMHDKSKTTLVVCGASYHVHNINKLDLLQLAVQHTHVVFLFYHHTRWQSDFICKTGIKHVLDGPGPCWVVYTLTNENDKPQCRGGFWGLNVTLLYLHTQADALKKKPAKLQCTHVYGSVFPASTCITSQGLGGLPPAPRTILIYIQ